MQNHHNNMDIADENHYIPTSDAEVKIFTSANRHRGESTADLPFTHSRCCKHCLFCLSAVASLVFFATGFFLASRFFSRSDSVEVSMGIGTIRGRVVDSPAGEKVQEYLGIPFALPPIGKLRYSDPEPILRLPQNPYDATNMRHSCVQYLDWTFGHFPGSAMWNTPNKLDEDCLYLNIWKPHRLSKTPLAIMVWLYGGGFYSGSNALWLYDGKTLADHGNLIVISINYRVSSFGYLNTGDERIKGNFGMKDQVEALRWINRHIAAFGGDVNSVTLFGESSGASSAGLHMMSPGSEPLFTRAILQSGSAHSHWAYMTMEQARQRSEAFLAAVNCSYANATLLLRCLRELPAAEILEAEWVDLRFMVFPWVPAIDGEFITESPLQLLQQAHFQRKDVLLGINQDEGTYWTLYALPGFSKDSRSLQNNSMFDAAIDVIGWDLSPAKRLKLVELYKPQNETDLDGFRDALNNVCGDRSFACPTEELADVLGNSGQATYFYYLKHRASNEVWPPWMGVIHGAEIQWVFGMPLNESRGYTEEEMELSKTIMSYWSNFAKTGNPNSNDVPKWPPYSTHSTEHLLIAGPSEFSIENKLRDAHCTFWRQLQQELMSEEPVQ